MRPQKKLDGYTSCILFNYFYLFAKVHLEMHLVMSLVMNQVMSLAFLPQCLVGQQFPVFQVVFYSPKFPVFSFSFRAVVKDG